MISLEKPKNFSPRFEIVSIFCEYNDTFVLLHRKESKPQGNTWGIPAGKVEDGESLEEAILRELEQETGIKMNEKELKYFNKVYVRYPDYDFIYHIFHAKLPEKKGIYINKQEHKDFVWVDARKALKMPLIPDEDECIRLFYGLH